MEIFKTFEEFCNGSPVCEGFREGFCDICENIFNAAQSWPNDKIKRALEVLKLGSGDKVVLLNMIQDAIKILEEK